MTCTADEKHEERATTGTARYDSAEYLDTDEGMPDYLAAAVEEGDAALFRHALGVVARARGMTQIARDAGLSRESLYRALSDEGNPSLDAAMRVLKALNVRLTASGVPVTSHVFER